MLCKISSPFKDFFSKPKSDKWLRGQSPKYGQNTQKKNGLYLENKHNNGKCPNICIDDSVSVAM